MPKEVDFQTDWEDGEVASVTKLICSCGENLVKSIEYVASHNETVDCPKCGAKYQFIWQGMTIKTLKKGRQE